MVFEFKVRDISKKDMKKLQKKYLKSLKKGENFIEIACNFFLEFVYLYFDNDDKKLFRLFFPVIMANFIENGSIHSVTEEYRKQKNLYSWSYAYRTIAKLDEDTGLNISRIFRKAMFNIIKKLGFKNKGYCIAIDITAKPFYGNKNLIMVKGYKRQAGTNYSIQYMTASIIEEGVRFNLLCFPISSLDSLTRRFESLVREVNQSLPLKLLFLDRGFGNKKYSRILISCKHKFIMPITSNRKLKELELSIKEQLELSEEEYCISSLNYIFGEDLAKENQLSVRLIAICNTDGVAFFITNIYALSLEEYYQLANVYKYRFGIETNYRVDNIFSPFTCSTKAGLRYLHMQISLMAQDLWTFVNFLSHSEDKKQPREKFKVSYKIMDIIRARIADIEFVWRPVFTAIQFKRQVDKILG